jgi:hypothetical protein
MRHLSLQVSLLPYLVQYSGAILLSILGAGSPPAFA